MKEKNRFSHLLQYLMSVSELKNYTLAKELQYDESYISKWVSGRMLPSEKNIDKVLHGISKCIVNVLDEANEKLLCKNYLVDGKRDLEAAIYDNLVAEYSYVKSVREDARDGAIVPVTYYAELTLERLARKMRHPVLRRVNNLEVVAAMDILSMDYKYRMDILGLGTEGMTCTRYYPDVHFSLVINLEVGERDFIYDSIFLLNLLTNQTYTDSQLYGASQVYNKIIYAVKDAFSATGMLIDNSQCISATLSEKSEICNALYRRGKALCNNESLLVRKVTMEEMLENYEYIQSVISKNPCWIVGHMTEHFLPEDLFEAILNQYDLPDLKTKKENLRRIHGLTRKIIAETRVQVLIDSSALENFAVSGELDFYNQKIYLSTEQRCRYIQHIMNILKENDKLELKLIQGEIVMDSSCAQKQCIFLSDSICYMRLKNDIYQNNIVVLNNMTMKDIFRRFFREIWINQKNIIVEGRDSVLANLNHTVESLRFLAMVE